jgi:hypothetical protein
MATPVVPSQFAAGKNRIIQDIMVQPVAPPRQAKVGPCDAGQLVG